MLQRGLFLWTLLVFAACGSETTSGPDMDIILASDPAPTLAAYGLFEDASADQPAARVIAYDLINPLFTDYADKHRFAFVPDGKEATYHETDVFDFPVGTVLIKTFGYAADMRDPETDAWKLETRLLIHKRDGWAASAYVWNEAQTEATYAPIGAKRQVATISPAGSPLNFTYAVPNTNQCKTCHQSGHDIKPIGPKARNLSHVGPYGAEQLKDWETRGILTDLPETVRSVPSAFDAALPLEARARAYLDVNCGHCHKPDGSASNSGLWLQSTETSPVRLGIGKHPTAAGRGAGDLIYVIEPGQPDTSILAFRMASTAPGIAMPELGRTLDHSEGVALINAWIDQMESPE